MITLTSVLAAALVMTTTEPSSIRATTPATTPATTTSATATTPAATPAAAPATTPAATPTTPATAPATTPTAAPATTTTATANASPAGSPESPDRGVQLNAVKLAPHTVFANHYSLTFGLDEVPSGDIALFFGRALPALAPTRAHRRWALGYQLTMSVGGADRYILSGFTHRHHLTAVGYGVRRPRLYVSIGGGIAIFAGTPRPAPPGAWRPSVAEFEGRLGYIFGARRHRRRLAGVVGGMARLGWNAASLEKAPVPQVGAFLGLLLR